jgi:HSP20 family protein
MLIRQDPFRDLDRLTASVLRGRSAERTMPMRAIRTSEGVTVSFDLPGVPPEDIDLTVDRNVLSVRAVRRADDPEGAEVLIDERGADRLQREVTLSDTLDPEGISASYEDGVLVVRVPVSRQATSRRVQVQGGGHRSQTVPTEGAAATDESSAGDTSPGGGTAPPAQPPPPEEQANPAPTS